MIQVTPELSVAETQALTAARQTADTSEEIKATDHVYIERKMAAMFSIAMSN